MRVCAITVAGRRPAGQRRRRRHGADLGPRHRPAAAPSWTATGLRSTRVCAVTVAGRTLLASGGSDGTVRIWDPATGQQRAILEGHQAASSAVCPITVAGRDLLASGGGDGTVRIWDPATGQQRAVLEGHHGWVARCARHRGRPEPAGQRRRRRHGADLGPRHRRSSTPPWRATRLGQRRVRGHRGRRGRCWPAAAATARCGSGTPPPARSTPPLEGHQDAVTAVCAVTLTGRHLLASGGDDGTVRIWDPATGQERTILDGHTGGSTAVCASPGRPGPAGQRRQRRHGADLGPRHRPAAAPPWKATRAGRCGVRGHRGRPRPAGQRRRRRHGADLGPRHRQQQHHLAGHTGSVRRCARSPGRTATLLASGGDDGTVRIWDPATGQQRDLLARPPGRGPGGVPVTLDGRTCWPAAATTARCGSGTPRPEPAC